MTGRSGLLVAAWAALALSGCAPEPAWNVLLVTFDTTRADHIGAYGYAGDTTPNVDRLAAEGLRFEHAYSTNPITLPAHTSIMTGTYPPVHGVRDNGTYVLRDDLNTLAEVLHGQGYSTAAVVGAFVLDSRFNIDQGFDEFNDQVEADWSRDELLARAADAFGFAERKANLVTLAAREWLERRPREPFFLWLHYFDPHEPRNPPEPHHSRFTDPYDGELAFADEQLGKVLDALRASGEYERTLIVFTADHGEGLLEHGEPTHSLLVYDSTIRIPLILRIPGADGGRVATAPVSGVDVMPTILALLGIEIPSEVQGEAVVGPGGVEVPDRHRFLYGESLVGRIQHGWGELRYLRDGRYKLHYGPTPRLYDIESDPGEVFDLAAKEPERVEAMEAQLARLLGEWATEGEGAPTALSADEVRKLQSLGYAAAGSVSRRTSEDLDEVVGKKDPYAERYLFDLFGVANENIRSGHYLQGIRQLEEIVAVDPESPMALTTLGMTYLLDAGQTLKAQEVLQRSLELDPLQENARYFLARSFVRLGDLQAAREQCEKILEFMPESVAALLELGRILGTQGEIEEAGRHYELALEQDPSNVPVLVGYGSFLARQGEHDEAGPYLHRALDLDPGNAEALYNLGIWYLQGEDRKNAVLYLERAQAANPDDRDAPYVLGRLYLEEERWEQARQALDRADRLAPSADRKARIAALRDRLPPS